MAGVMYLPARGNQVLALDADTGKEVWRYVLPRHVTTTARGVAYWPGDGQRGARILLTAGPRLLALDAASGQPAGGFGADGIVEIGVPWNGVPTIYKNVAILGATTGETTLGIPGDTRAFDVRTGKKLWDFHTVPLPGEVGHNTWLDNGWRGRSGVNVWAWYMTLDAERGILYMPVAGPSGNYWGGDRPGNNLFSNSIVAVDAETGKLPVALPDRAPRPVGRGHAESAGAGGHPAERAARAGAGVGGEDRLHVHPRPRHRQADLRRRGTAGAERPRARRVVLADAAVPGKAGEAAVARGLRQGARPGAARGHLGAARGRLRGVVGEERWVRQRRPLHAVRVPQGRGAAEEHDPVSRRHWRCELGRRGRRPDHRLRLRERARYVAGRLDRVQAAGPELRQRNTEGSTQPYDRGSVNGAGPYFNFNAPYKDASGRTLATLPCQRPPWARLVAVNANTGEIAWETPLGLTEALPEGKQRTGNSGSAGPTVTAGGVVFVGATTDRRLRAFDAKTGKELWAVRLDGQVNANPMTYRGKTGKQYVAAVATDSLVVFALP